VEGRRRIGSPDNLVNGKDRPWVSVRVTFFLRIRQAHAHTCKHVHVCSLAFALFLWWSRYLPEDC